MLGIISKYSENDILKNSIFYINEKKLEYQIFNNLTLIFKKYDEIKNNQKFFEFSDCLLEKFFNKYFLNYFEASKDFSNIFIIFIFNTLDIIIFKNNLDKSYLNNLNKQIKNTFYYILEFLNSTLYSKNFYKDEKKENIFKPTCIGLDFNNYHENEKFIIQKYLIEPIIHKIKDDNIFHQITDMMFDIYTKLKKSFFTKENSGKINSNLIYGRKISNKLKLWLESEFFLFNKLDDYFLNTKVDKNKSLPLKKNLYDENNINKNLRLILLFIFL